MGEKKETCPNLATRTFQRSIPVNRCTKALQALLASISSSALMHKQCLRLAVEFPPFGGNGRKKRKKRRAASLQIDSPKKQPGGWIVAASPKESETTRIVFAFLHYMLKNIFS